MSDTSERLTSQSYSALGFVDDPFVAPAAEASDSEWVRVVGQAAANRLLSACHRAHKRSVPVLVTMSEDIPEYYYRVAQNNLLARTAAEPELGVMALNIPLEMMRLGRIRGTLAELSELVVAVDMPLTLGAWYAGALEQIDSELPESALVTAEEVAEARDMFSRDPHAAVESYFTFDAQEMSDSEMDVVVHEAYLRQVAQPVEVATEEEGAEVVAFDPDGSGPVAASVPLIDEPETEADPAAGMREYLLAVAASRLSPVLSRAFASFGRFGEALAAQELKITKAPRKTLAALLRFMSVRWPNVVVIFDSFDAWPMLDQKVKVDVLASLTELRYIIGETGVMVVGVIEGIAPEIAEQFAAAEQVDWMLPEIHALSRGDRTLDTATVQSWLDAASVDGTSKINADGPELAPIVAAASGDIMLFATMARAAISDAASRSVSTLDETAVAAGLAVRPGEAGV